MSIRLLVTSATVLFIGACSSTQVEREYGESVRQMINAQVANPASLTSPSDKPVEGADPDQINTALEVFRENVSRPEDVSQDIVLQVGGGR